MQHFKLRAGVILTTMLAMAVLWSLQPEHVSPVQAQADDSVCRNEPAFAEDYDSAGDEIDIYCVNNTADAPDINIGDEVCDSDEATAGQQCTLRAAIMEANAPPASDEDFILVPAGYYQLTIDNGDVTDEDSNRTGDLDILSTVTIKGEGKAEVTVDANNLDRAFHNRYSVNDPTYVTIANMTIINGAINEGNIFNTGNLTVDNVIVDTYDAAGIYNLVDLSQGYVGILTVTNSIIRGGGDKSPSRGMIILGGILVLDNSIIENNYTTNDGAGLYARNSSLIKIQNGSKISNNTAFDKLGGGIFLTGGGNTEISFSMENSTVSNNEAKEGGGLYTNNTGRVDIVNSTFSGNIARDKDNSDGANNRGQINSGRGGALYHNSPYLLTIDQSTISDNKANSHGGGLYIANNNNQRVAVITSSTIAYNVANADGGDYGDGGGIFAQLSLNNIGPQPEKSGTASLKNTILAGNMDNSLADLDKRRDCAQVEKAYTAPMIQSEGYNLIGHNFGCAETFPESNRQPKPFYPNNYLELNENNDWVGSRREQDDTVDNLTGPIDPQLLPLRDNGGGIETHALLPSDEPVEATSLEKRSFAIDNGTPEGCATEDARGAPRPSDGDNDNGLRCDIGAYETVPNDISVLMTVSTPRAASNQEVFYTIDYVNQGAKNATEIVLDNAVPFFLTEVSYEHYSPDNIQAMLQSGSEYRWELTNMRPGDSGVITVSGRVDPNLTNVAVINNAASIEMEATDNMADNNRSIVEMIAVPGADLSIALHDFIDPAPVNQVMTYTAIITNEGPTLATGVVVSGTIPTGSSFNANSSNETCDFEKSSQTVSCTVALLGVNASTEVIIGVKAPNAPGLINFEVAVTSLDQPDPFPENNSAQESTDIRPDVDLSVEVTVDPEEPKHGEEMTYNIKVSNAGPQPAEDITVRNVWPPNVNLQNVEANADCDISATTRTVECPIARLNRGANETLRIIVEPVIPGTYQNQVWVDSPAADSDASNNYTETNTIVVQGNDPVPTITPQPTNPILSVTPDILEFSAVEGEANPANKSLTIANLGAGTLNWTVSSSAEWLSVSPASGTGADTVAVEVDITNLDDGPYQATLTITADGVEGSPKTVAVTLGVARSISNNITPGEGGNVPVTPLDEDFVLLQFPPAAVVAETRVKLNISNVPAQTVPNTFQTVGLAFSVQANQVDNDNEVTSFNQQFTLIVNYQNTSWGSLRDEATLNIYYWNPTARAGWQLVPCDESCRNTTDKVLTTQFDQAGDFVLMAEGAANLYLPILVK